ncbi:MAG TPA: response regulator [Candidatus Limnocylindrales bacterium]|nr:response regulator [Candidatus Limnocylindrales bacterium]
MITEGGMATGCGVLVAMIEASIQWCPGRAWAPIERVRGVAPGDRPRADPRARIHVLMIEDDAAIADMYRVQLEHDGYRVSIATTGEIAFTTLSGTSPDVVLLDLLLPDRSGFEVLAMLNDRLPSHPPVVILSNYGEPSMMDRGRALGAVEYLVKSRVTPADVSRLIPGWAAHPRAGGPQES